MGRTGSQHGAIFADGSIEIPDPVQQLGHVVPECSQRSVKLTFGLERQPEIEIGICILRLRANGCTSGPDGAVELPLRQQGGAEVQTVQGGRRPGLES